MLKTVVISLLVLLGMTNFAVAEDDDGKRHARPLVTKKIDRVGMSVEIRG